jgi:hypothetical protein
VGRRIAAAYPSAKPEPRSSPAAETGDFRAMTLVLPEYVDGLPNLAGHEEELDAAIAAAAGREVFRPDSPIRFDQIKSAAAIALHMHQPLIPAGGHDLQTATVISNLKYMMDNQHLGDNYNAGPFVWCYKRMGEFIPQLVHEG